MKVFTNAELQEIFRLHKLYLASDPKGERADLSSANLSSANLRSADLSSANLRSADLSSANLSFADLRSADLSSANLSFADLSSANLRSADLSSADLSFANLRFANLRSADLSSADLSFADLSSANLRFANLSSADLSSANLRSANLSFANLSFANLRSAKGIKEQPAVTIILPQEGSFIGYKKVYADESPYILTLQICEGAARLSAIGNRKCRAASALVLKAEGIKGGKTSLVEFKSGHNPEFKYKVGDVARADKFDPSFLEVCSGGIHFYLTKQEAQEHC